MLNLPKTRDLIDGFSNPFVSKYDMAKPSSSAKSEPDIELVKKFTESNSEDDVRSFFNSIALHKETHWLIAITTTLDPVELELKVVAHLVKRDPITHSIYFKTMTELSTADRTNIATIFRDALKESPSVVAKSIKLDSINFAP